MNNNEFQKTETTNIDIEKMKEENSEAYLNALRKLEQEKKAEKKAKKKKRRKKIRIAFFAVIGAIILVLALIPSIAANQSVSYIKDYINNPESRTQSLIVVVDEYIKYDLHSEEKEINNLYKLGKKAFDKGDLETAGYLFKICVEYSEDYKNKIVNATSYENIDSFLTASAKKAFEAGSYNVAIEIYKACENQKSVAKELKEAKYNHGISCIKNGNLAVARAVLREIEGYKYSDALIIWITVQEEKAFNDPTEARRELKARLKDPSSYQEISTHSWGLAVVTKEEGKPCVRMMKYTSIKYSATNSFGGRIQDTYYWEKKGTSIPGAGYTSNELENIVKMNKQEIIDKAASAK